MQVFSFPQNQNRRFKSPLPKQFCVDGGQGESFLPSCEGPRGVWWSGVKADVKPVILTACTFPLSPQIPQNRKVIGGGHSIGQLWRHKQR